MKHLTVNSVALYSKEVNLMSMILPTTLLIGALGYLFYSSKKEFVLDEDYSQEKSENNDDLYKDLEDLFI